jgi:dipeptidyl aminopeptidase/acylaminoacyl peptidase
LKVRFISALGAVFLFAALAAAGSAFAAPHPFSVHDMLAMDRVSDAQVSPDGSQVAFTLRVTDVAANKGRTDIWVASVDGARVRRLTTSDASDWNARWGANGQVYFLSTRSGSTQIWRLDPAGGEAVQVTKLDLPVGGFEMAPQAGGFLLTMEVFAGLGIDGTVKRDAVDEKKQSTGLAYDELIFRHWDTWEDGKRNHLFLLSEAPGAQPVDLMPKLDADAPTLPFGGLEEVAVTPDGREVVFSAKILPGSEEAWKTDTDLYVVPADGSGTMRCLTEANEAVDTEPVFTPDGKQLWWLAMDRAGYEADRLHIAMMDWPNGKVQRLDITFPTTELDRPLDLSPGSLTFTPDGRSVYFTAGCLGQTSVFRLDRKTNAVTRVIGKGHVTDLCLLPKGLLIGTQNLKQPTELYTTGFDGKVFKPVTNFNGAKLADAQMGDYEQYTFKGWNGETVFAYVVKPYDWTPEAAAAGRKWPVAFLVHGGPQGSFGNDFHYRWNPQAYVGAGFTTVAVDFHGSTGYGQAFTDAINGHWGDRPLEDLEKGLDAALAKYTWMDGSRVVAAGASYGGYMINWMAGQPFHKKFKAFVCHDGNLDERMAYFDTEELWFPEWEHGGVPWENPEGYTKHNPIDYVQNWEVPTLVVHGGKDYRVVDTQGLSTFTALRRKGVPARLLYFPDENHWVLKPANSIQWHTEVMDWLTRWTK